MVLVVLTDKLIVASKMERCLPGLLKSLWYSRPCYTFVQTFPLWKKSESILMVSNYLSNRKQYVTYKRVSSPVNNITCGVPQWSIFGPLLFLLYINDLGHICSSTTSILFADDTNVFKSANDLNKMQDELNSESPKLSLWLKVNKLSLNIGKHILVYTYKKKRLDE